MVPTGDDNHAYLESFPRASGDGPMASASASPLFSFPPRERGWSPAKHQQIEAGYVSPARAGMVPAGTADATALARFPRASGDGPDEYVINSVQVQFPPRERGWSRIGAEGASVQGVSPARAGMQARTQADGFARNGFPRASGDAGRPSPTYYGWLCSRESLLRPQPAQEDSHAKAQKSP